jgi:Fur family ferric uptake transcriptional regulator
MLKISAETFRQPGRINTMQMQFKKDIATLCKENGLRLTGPRRVIMKVLSEATDHPDVVELHRRVGKIDPGIAIATVYRTVNVLQDKGVLERHTFGDGRSRYEPAAQEHHDHLINIETGDVTEFRSDEIERLQEEIARQHGFTIVSHKLEIYVKPLEASGSRSKPEPHQD